MTEFEKYVMVWAYLWGIDMEEVMSALISDCNDYNDCND